MGTIFIQVDAPFETIHDCGFEWWNNCVQCWFPKWFWMVHVHVGQLIQNLVWIFPNGSTANTKPCLDTSKWWSNGPCKTIWMDLNGSTACYQHCSNGITMCVHNQWAFLKVEILNGFKWSISRRVYMYNWFNSKIIYWSTLSFHICETYENNDCPNLSIFPRNNFMWGVVTFKKTGWIIGRVLFPEFHLERISIDFPVDDTTLQAETVHCVSYM